MVKNKKLFYKITKVFAKIEFLAAYIQGKGYGTSTIKLENRLLNSLLTIEPKLALDIGGNIGDYSFELRKLYPNLEIHIFEPSKYNIAILNKRYCKDSLIKINECAVSSYSGDSVLYSNKSGSGLASLSKRDLSHINVVFNIEEKVNIVSVYDYWQSVLFGRILDIVKLDIEGHELEALKGFNEVIHKTRIIQFEFGGCNIDTRTYFKDFWIYFSALNFKLFRISPIGLVVIDNYTESDECFTTTNFIAVNINLLGK